MFQFTMLNVSVWPIFQKIGFVEGCECRTDFYGDQCDKVVCYNGGVSVNNRGCACPAFYVGPHCQWRTDVGKFASGFFDRMKNLAHEPGENILPDTMFFGYEHTVPLNYRATL